MSIVNNNVDKINNAIKQINNEILKRFSREMVGLKRYVKFKKYLLKTLKSLMEPHKDQLREIRCYLSLCQLHPCRRGEKFFRVRKLLFFLLLLRRFYHNRFLTQLTVNRRGEMFKRNCYRSM